MSDEKLRNEVRAMGWLAKAAARSLATVPGARRAEALRAMAAALPPIEEALRQANDADVRDAEAKGLAGPLVQRLRVTPKVLAYMQDRLHQIALLPDPVGRVLEGHTRPNGLRVERVSVPIGVIGIIYESRPNVTSDAASVCLKSGNAVILRGGSESLRTNAVLADAMISAACASGLPDGAIQLLRTPDHAAVGHLLRMDDCVDVLIPRGGKRLIQRVTEESRIPVIKHYDGICHQYIAADADAAMAVAVCVNSKCQRVEVCNALEKLLVDTACAEAMLPLLAAAFAEQGVALRGCPRCREIVPGMAPATDSDWTTEYLAPVLAVKLVDGVQTAIDHINTHSSGHTDGIITQSLDRAQSFVQGVDSASVLVNASTRLSGGGDYGMGAVVGISTDKLHARGPVGPNELTSYKWIAYGDGHLRD